MIRPVPGLQIESQPQDIIDRLVLADECRGERDAGGDLDAFPMLAVWHVIQNRAIRAGTSRKTQILKPQQFSGFNVVGGHREQMLEYWKTDETAWTRADAVCDLAERGNTIDPTLGSLNYYNPRTSKPAWGEGHPGWRLLRVIGSHYFGVAGA